MKIGRRSSSQTKSTPTFSRPSPLNSCGELLRFAAECRVLTLVPIDSAPDDWIPLIHPEGALYWVHRTEVSSGPRTHAPTDPTRFKPVYTDTNLCDQDLRQEIEQSVEEIAKLREISPPLPEDWELVLELGVDDETGEPTCSYYFVCHSSRCLFWLHEFDLESVLDGLRGVTEKTHIREPTPIPGTHRTERVTRPGVTGPVLVGNDHGITTKFWLTTPRSHWETFPHDRDIPEELLQELSGILLHAGIGASGPESDLT